MSLLQPSFLLLLLAIPVLWFWPRRVRDIGHGLLRSALVALLAFALARPVWLHEGATPIHVLVEDHASYAGDFETVIRAADSRVSAALSAAARAIPNGAPGSVTLASDGFFADRGWEDTVFQLKQRDPTAGILPEKIGATRLSPPDVELDPLEGNPELRQQQPNLVAVSGFEMVVET